MDVGAAVRVAVGTGVGSGAGAVCGLQTVRAKKLSRSTCAEAVDAAKSTVVGKGIQAPSWCC